MRATLVRDVRFFMWWKGGTVRTASPRRAETAKDEGVSKHGEQRSGRRLMSPAASVRVLWRCPTLPQPGGCSTIGAAGLSFQVRNGGWAFPRCYDHHKYWCSTRFPAPCCFGGGCGLIVVCIVVAARRFVRLFVVTRTVCWVLFSVGPLVPVGSRAHCCASTSGLSTR